MLPSWLDIDGLRHGCRRREILAGSLTAQQHRKIEKLLARHTDSAVAAFDAALWQDPIADWIEI